MRVNRMTDEDMVLPIRLYGDPVLREETVEVDEDHDGLQDLIDQMIETMRGASGLGLAAPQVGRKERLFVVDLSPIADELEEKGISVPPQPMVLINPVIEAETEELVEFEEGCLSIPEVREVVTRPEGVDIRYFDRHFNERTLEADAMLARVIQHEYDHLEGILFLDHVSAFRRQLLRRKLRAVRKGKMETDYPVEIPE